MHLINAAEDEDKWTSYNERQSRRRSPWKTSTRLRIILPKSYLTTVVRCKTKADHNAPRAGDKEQPKTRVNS